MKNVAFILLIVLITNLLFAQNNQKNINFELKIEPKIELLTVLLNYSYWDYFGKFKSTKYEYYNNVKAHFDKYKEHPSIKWFNKASKNWNLDDPASLILWFDGIPLKQNIPFPLHATSQVDTNEAKQFIEKLNQFAEDTNFKQFWENNEATYASMLNKIKSSIPYENNIKLMEDFYGEIKGKFIFVLAPLINGASFGPQVKTKEFTNAYFISGFDEMKDGVPYFNHDYLNMFMTNRKPPIII